jgi:hypothetical protein
VEGFVVMSLVWLLLRIVGPIYCAMKAEKLNRSMGMWAFLAFLFPIICMVWISLLKPITKWSKEQ